MNGNWDVPDDYDGNEGFHESSTAWGSLTLYNVNANNLMRNYLFCHIKYNCKDHHWRLISLGLKQIIASIKRIIVYTEMIYLHMRKIAEFQKVCDDYQHKALNTRLSETAMSTKASGPEVAKRGRSSRDRGGYRTEYFASGWLSYFQVSKFTVIHLLPWTA